jgi:fidgetin-like protein 1
VDLLETLKKSREEVATSTKEGTSQQKADAVKASPTTSHSAGIQVGDSEATNWLGGGTIPPLDYADLSRPPLPKRPTPAPRASSASSATDFTQSRSSSRDTGRALSPNFITSPASLSGMGARTPSPEKKSRLLRTLRSNSRESRPFKMPGTLRSGPPAAAKAASQAWGSLATAPKGSPNDDGGASLRDSRRPHSLDLSSMAVSQLPGPSYAESAAASSLGLNQTSNENPWLDDGAKITRYRSQPSVQAEAKPSKDLRPDVRAQTKVPSITKGIPGGPLKGNAWIRERQSKELPSLPYRNEYLPSKPVSSPLPKKHGVSLSSPQALSSAGEPLGNSRGNRDGGQSASYNHLMNAPTTSFTGIENTTGVNHVPQESEFTNDLRQTQPPGEGSPQEETEHRSSLDTNTATIPKHLPKGVDLEAAKQILNEIVIQGDEVHWDDIAGLEIAKAALKETVVYPFLRPDLFMGLREPARGMLLFGPPGTGKTMLARAVATESRSTFFAISASSLTSKYLGESEKLVRALFALAKAMAPSIIFVDEIDSLLSARQSGSEHESTRRIKTEFLIQWSDLAKAAAGREQRKEDRERGDASRVLVLAATNLPWAIDEAARRRFVRRQYIPLPEDHVRKLQLNTLLGHQKHSLTDEDLEELVSLTDGRFQADTQPHPGWVNICCIARTSSNAYHIGFSGSDITALAKDAAMGPLRSLGEKLLDMRMDDIRPIGIGDFRASLSTIRPSVSKQGLREFEDWAREFGERGG